MGEQDLMTLQTMFRIGKLHYLANRKDAAMEALGDTLAKQEKLLGFDNAEATKTRDLLNEILSERVTSRVLEENLLVYEEETIIGPQLPTVLADFDKNESSERLTGEVKADSNQSDNSDQLQSDFLKGLTSESDTISRIQFLFSPKTRYAPTWVYLRLGWWLLTLPNCMRKVGRYWQMRSECHYLTVISKKALEKETLLSFRRFSDGVGKKVKLKNGVYERRKSTGNLEETGALR